MAKKKLSKEKIIVELDIHKFIDACMDGMFWGRRIHNNGYTAMEKATPDLHKAGRMTMADIEWFFLSKLIDHPGTDSSPNGCKTESAIQSVQRHVRGLIKCGALKVLDVA